MLKNSPAQSITYWPSQDTCMFFGSALSGLEERPRASQKKNILSIDLHPQRPDTNDFSTWQRSCSQSASWDKGNQEQLYLSGFICISKSPVGKSLNTAERICSNGGSYEFKKSSVNKQ